LKNVFVTNGYINREPLLALLPFADAFNIDLKGMQEDFYRKVIGGKLKNVLETIEEIARKKEIVLEVTTLIIPGYNDSDEEMEKLTGFLASLRPDIPYHLSAYYPMYQFDAPPTPISSLKRLRDVASRKMQYVYLGNVSGPSNTFCHNCGSLLIERHGYAIRRVDFGNGNCSKCGISVPIAN
jgi:pyruvate formate lyase activating enzyme